MPRLPVPGQDNGVWGTILNDFLAVEHNTDGSLKASGSLASKANDNAVVHLTGAQTVSGVKTFADSPLVPTPTAGSQAATKAYVDGVAGSSGAPDADATTKGILQLAGDLAGTAASPTVPGLTGKEPVITAGTTAQYWRGDKSWQALDKAAVGLDQVDNTSDATKNSASATLTNKTLTSPVLTTPAIDSFVNAIHDHTNAAGGGQFTDAALSSAVTVAKGGTGATTLTGLVVGNGTSAFTAITAPTGDVVGTTDTQTLTNKTISGASNTLSNVPQGAVTNLTTDLSGKTDKSTLTTKGDIYVATAAGAVSGLGVGPDDQVLTADSSTATGLKWAAVSTTDTDAVHKGDLFANVQDYGAVGTGAADDTAAIQAALTAATHVYVPPGTYRIDGMIELGTGKVLQLAGGAYLRRLSASSASTEPVVWMKSPSCSFYGAGQTSSGVSTENRAPNGVVRLGHKDMTESHNNVTYCTLTGMDIVGAVANGQTTGAPDVALYMANPQIGGFVSYFHNVHDLRVANSNYGIWLQGWANANTISNVQGYRLGNTTLGVNTNAFIYCQGALDNVVSNCFFHSSANSIGLLVDDIDNTGNGGVVHNAYANSFSGLSFEQGGGSALGVKALAGTSSFYEVRSNVAGGNSVYSGFYTSNMLFSLGNDPVFNSVDVNDLTSTTTVTSDIVLVGGTTDDTYSKLRVNGALRVGTKAEKTYSGTGTQTVIAHFGTTLTGAFYRNAVIEIVFHGIMPGAGNNQVSRYYVPVSGSSTWALGTPTLVYGATLTITQTANSSNTVTFTVAGGDATQLVTVHVMGIHNTGFFLE